MIRAKTFILPEGENSATVLCVVATDPASVRFFLIFYGSAAGMSSQFRPWACVVRSVSRAVCCVMLGGMTMTMVHVMTMTPPTHSLSHPPNPGGPSPRSGRPCSPRQGVAPGAALPPFGRGTCRGEVAAVLYMGDILLSPQNFDVLGSANAFLEFRAGGLVYLWEIHMFSWCSVSSVVGLQE